MESHLATSGQPDGLSVASLGAALPTSGSAEFGGVGAGPDAKAAAGAAAGDAAAAEAAAAVAARTRSHHTQVFSEGGDTVVRLHQTNIVTIRANGDVVLSSGGWRTHQSLKGINLSLQAVASGLQLVADGHVADASWRVTNGRDWSAPFYDGIVVPRAGPPNLAAQAAQTPGLWERLSVGTEEEEAPAPAGAPPPPPPADAGENSCSPAPPGLSPLGFLCTN